MQSISSSELKTILHSKRANIYYLEHCRLLVNGGRVEYVTDAGKENLYWNIPIANTTAILLGSGTSVTQAAMRELGKAGVLVGFCGGGGTPLFTATERFDCVLPLTKQGDTVQESMFDSPLETPIPFIDILWFSPQSEYRPTEYLQQWVSFWFFENLRLQAAKSFQLHRLNFLERIWNTDKLLKENNFADKLSSREIETVAQEIENAPDGTALLTIEARFTKKLFALAAHAVKYGDFTRSHRGSGTDIANRFLDHGNYLAYGLGATATWVLGIPHGLAVLHGKTRRGGLVFDVADLVKDALVLPLAFISAMRGLEEQEFRQNCIEFFTRYEALDFMIDTIKTVAQETTNLKGNML